MFKRKLMALNHVNPDSLDLNDEKTVRAMVLWLEDQKIRLYKIEDRTGLRNIDSPKWKEAYQVYLKDLDCPFTTGALADQIEWLIGYAVKLEYSDNVDKYKTQTMENIKSQQTSAPKIVSSNPLDNLDFNSDDFKKGVISLAKILNVPSHPDHLVMLEAVSKIVKDRLNEEVIANPSNIIPKGNPFPIFDADLGFDMGDPVANKAAKILRILYIQDLRCLQTRINECIVVVQKVTANPKTDTKIGKVGF